MDNKEFLSYYEWSMRVSRLLELIAMTNRIIQIHKEAGESTLYIKQYGEFLEEYTTNLNELMQVMGLSIQIHR